MGLRDVVIAEAGPITHIEHATAGSIGDFTATLTSGAARIFCKGAQLDTNGAGFLRNEIRLNHHLPADLVPRLRWHHEAQGWLIAAFDHAAGRHADLRPGSADLPLIAATLTRMATALTPCPPISIQPATARWGRLLSPALVDGDTLLHTDMTHNNFLIDDDHVHVVDWSMPCRGAIWLDTARMLVRLIRAGHTPEQAETWAAGLPTWSSATPDAIDAFATALAKTSRRLRDNRANAAPPSGARRRHQCLVYASLEPAVELANESLPSGFDVLHDEDTPTADGMTASVGGIGDRPTDMQSAGKGPQHGSRQRPNQHECSNSSSPLAQQCSARAPAL